MKKLENILCETIKEKKSFIVEASFSFNSGGQYSDPTFGFPVGGVDSKLVTFGGVNDDWGGSMPRALAFARVATDFLKEKFEKGNPITSQKRSLIITASGGISDHWAGNLEAYAIDIKCRGKEGDALFEYLMDWFGHPNVKSGKWINISEGGYRYQIGWRVGGHYGHIHIGVKKEGSKKYDDTSSSSSIDANKVKLIDEKFIKTLIEKLKEKNIKREDFERILLTKTEKPIKDNNDAKTQNIGDLIINEPNNLKDDTYALIFGGMYYANPKWMLEQLPDNIKNTKNIIIAPYTTSLRSVLDKFKDVKVSSVSGFSAGGKQAFEAIGRYSFIGLIDPSVPSSALNITNFGNSKMIYNTTWRRSSIEEVAKNMGDDAIKVSSGHEKIPKEFFDKFGDLL
jgi:hypothetical protein